MSSPGNPPAAAATNVPPPLGDAAFVRPDGRLTVYALQFLTRLWSSTFGVGGIQQITNTFTTEGVTQTGTVEPGNVAVWAASQTIEDGGPMPETDTLPPTAWALLQTLQDLERLIWALCGPSGADKIDFSTLPTTPGAPGTLWLNGGFVCVA